MLHSDTIWRNYMLITRLTQQQAIMLEKINQHNQQWDWLKVITGTGKIIVISMSDKLLPRWVICVSDRERERSLALKMKHCFFAKHDESAGVQNTVVMWAVVPPGGDLGGSWLPVLPPGGRTCSNLIMEMIVIVYILCLFFVTTCADEHHPVQLIDINVCRGSGIATKW